MNAKAYEDIFKLDALVYNEKYWSPSHEVRERFLKNPDIYTYVTYDDVLIGYLSSYPIQESIFEGILSGEIHSDSYFPADWILPYQDNTEQSVYIISFVIHPEYQN